MVTKENTKGCTTTISRVAGLNITGMMCSCRMVGLELLWELRRSTSKPNPSRALTLNRKKGLRPEDFRGHLRILENPNINYLALISKDIIHLQYNFDQLNKVDIECRTG